MGFKQNTMGFKQNTMGFKQNTMGFKQNLWVLNKNNRYIPSLCVKRTHRFLVSFW